MATEKEKRLRDRSSGGRALLVETVPACLDPLAWGNGAVPQDMRAYRDVEVQVSGLSGGDSISITRSLVEGGTYVAPKWVSHAFETGDVITADGTYGFSGFALLKWAKTGNASNPSVVIRGSN
ncbi:hypothetical protein [Sphingomonas jatrophae]|uniref:Uncharacterized protein n=1 Tax=Sphingomonas jatrophae TaxID=1166337 RepID=A0A1I6JLA5_9SPHN|nr:hypothetical protein [Sphingomonas jatrophae]SFR79772.1 hypothetical protein SAMN05192580_0456 [Sphingomonas jatrophae]